MSDGETQTGVTAIAIEGRAVMLEGPPGAGKSTLALALIDRGATLIGDDGVTLARHDSRIMVSPPPNIAGKLEIRNVGIVDLPTTEASLSLHIRLTQDAPRFLETADTVDIFGLPTPVVMFDPAIAAAPMRAEWALRRYGLPI